MFFTASLFWTIVLKHLFFVAFFKNNCCSELYNKFEGLYLIGNYTSNAIKTNMDASQEYDHLRKDGPFIPDLGLTSKSTDLSITLLNILSLWRHAIEISVDVRFHTDIWPFTETYLAWWKYCWQENTLNRVYISYNNSINKYQSISFCYTDSFVLLSDEKELGVSVVFNKPDFSTNPVQLAIIYR